MKLSKRVAYLPLAFLAFHTGFSSASAQSAGSLGEVTVKTFKISDLKLRQGIITISPKAQVLLQFPSSIEGLGAMLSAQKDFVATIGQDAQDKFLFLDAVSDSGVADMTVFVNGEPLAFRLIIDSKASNLPRKYVVELDEDKPKVVAVQGTPTVQVEKLIGNSVLGGERSEIELGTDIKSTLDSSGKVTVNYFLENRSTTSLMLSPKKVQVFSKAGKLLPFQNLATPNRTSFPPATALAGTVAFDRNSGENEYILEVVLRSLTGGEFFTLRKTFSLQ